MLSGVPDPLLNSRVWVQAGLNVDVPLLRAVFPAHDVLLGAYRSSRLRLDLSVPLLLLSKPTRKQ